MVGDVRPFAAKTVVPVPKTREGIETMLRKAGAARIITMAELTEAVVAFQLDGRLIKMTVAVPDKASEQDRRTIWRAIDRIVQAKLISVASGIATAESEFLAYVVLPDGGTVGDHMKPQLQIAYDKGEMPSLLALPGKGTRTNG